jgi:hypothetical protein
VHKNIRAQGQKGNKSTRTKGNFPDVRGQKSARKRPAGQGVNVFVGIFMCQSILVVEFVCQV